MLQLLTALLSLTSGRQYGIGSFDVRTQDPNQPSYHFVDATVHYPQGGGHSQFPLLVFSPGFISGHRFYNYLWQALVPAGFVVCITSTYDYDPVSLPLWKAKDQSFLLSIPSECIFYFANPIDYLSNESANNPNSPIYSMLSGKSAAMGHSEGGAASFVSGSPSMVGHTYPITFDAIVVESGCFGIYGSIESFPYLLQALQNQTIPIFFITGTHDCICPPDQWDIAFYNQSTSRCRYLANIVDGGHCGFMTDYSDDLLCRLFADFAGCALLKIISQEQQQTQTVRYLFPYLNWQLKGIRSQKFVLDNYLQTDMKKNLVISSSAC